MQPTTVIIPAPQPVHPVIVTPTVHHSSGTGSDVPTEYVLAYVAAAVITWLATAIIQIRTGEENDPTTAVALGLVAGTAWPIVLAALPVWLAVRACRPKTR